MPAYSGPTTRLPMTLARPESEQNKSKRRDGKQNHMLIIGSLLIGFLLGGRDPAVRSVMGLGTAQRNVAAAILVSVQNSQGRIRFLSCWWPPCSCC